MLVGTTLHKLRLPLPRQIAPSTIPQKDPCSALTLTVSPPSSALQPEWLTQGQPVHRLAYDLVGKGELEQVDSLSGIIGAGSMGREVSQQ